MIIIQSYVEDDNYPTIPVVSSYNGGFARIFLYHFMVFALIYVVLMLLVFVSWLAIETRTIVISDYMVYFSSRCLL